MTTNSRFRRCYSDSGAVVIPLNKRTVSNISVDRYSERSIHDEYLDDKSYSEFIRTY